jgi:hypothetical protein
MGQPGAPKVNARAIAARFHRFVAEMTRHDALGEFRSSGAFETQQIVNRHRDHARVAAAACRARQAIKISCGSGGQAPEL